MINDNSILIKYIIFMKELNRIKPNYLNKTKLFALSPFTLSRLLMLNNFSLKYILFAQEAKMSLVVRKTAFGIPHMGKHMWLSGAVVRASDFEPRGPWFQPRPVHISLWA